MAAPRPRPLFSGPLVSITDFQCRRPDPACGAEERASADQIVFVRAGVFVRHDGARQVIAEPASVVLFNRHDAYRISHPGGIGDDCTALSFAPGVLPAPFPGACIPLAPTALLRLQSLRRRLRAGAASALEVEEVALQELGHVLHVIATATGKTTRWDPRAERRRTNIVEATKLALASRPHARVSLSSLARTVECSPYHLARIFRRRVGLPVYQYLLRLRLAVALDRIMDDGANLSTLAFELGFSSHSHFTTAFRRMFGLPPSLIRGLLKARRPPPPIARESASESARGVSPSVRN
jgi:AraC family transcriptional regulator